MDLSEVPVFENVTGARARTIASVCLALLLLLVTTLLVQRRSIARSLLDAQLRALGLQHVWHEVDRLGLAEFGVRDLRVGSDGDLEIDRVDARYSLASLWAGRLEEIVLSGVRLKGRIDGDGLSFGALDPALGSDGDPAGGAPASAPPTLPATTIAVDDFELELATPRGPVRVSFDARATDVDGAVGLSGSFAGQGSLQLAADSPKPLAALAASFALAGQITPANGSLALDLTATSSGGRIEAAIDGTLDPRAGGGELRVRIGRFALRPDDLAGALAVALLGQPFAIESGDIAARAAVSWGAERELTTALDLAVRELTMSSELGSCERLDAAIELNGPWPLHTPPGQLVSAARMDFGLELTNGFLDFQLLPDAVLDLAGAKWTFAGGMIRTRGRADLTADTQELVLDLDEIDLSALLELVDLEGLSGSGRLNGRIPLVRRDGRLAIRGGRAAASDAGGWIRYAADPGLAAAAAGDANLALLHGALANFRYDKLVASIDGDTSRPLTVEIHIAGANPDFMGGQPFEFNLNVESRLVDLLQRASAIYRLPDEIERRLQQISGASP